MKKRIVITAVAVMAVLLIGCGKIDEYKQALIDKVENAKALNEKIESVDESEKEDTDEEENLLLLTWVGEDALIIDIKDELLDECLSGNNSIVLCDASEEGVGILGTIKFWPEEEYMGDKIDCRLEGSLPDGAMSYSALSLREETICKGDRHKFLFRTGHFNVNDEFGESYSGGEWDNTLPDDATKHSIDHCFEEDTRAIDAFINVFEDDITLIDEFCLSDALAEADSKQNDYLAELFTEKDLEYFGEIGENYAVFSTTIPEVSRFEYWMFPSNFVPGAYCYEMNGEYRISVDARWIVTYSDNGTQDKSYIKLTFPTDMDAVSVDPKIYGLSDGGDPSDPASVSDPAEFDTYEFHERVSRMNMGYEETEVVFDGNAVYFMGSFGRDNGLMYIGVWSLNTDNGLIYGGMTEDAGNNDSGTINAQAECMLVDTYEYNGVTQGDEHFEYEDVNISYCIHKSS